MHLAQGIGNLTLTLENGLESLTIRFVVAKSAIDVLPMAGDEAAHRRGEPEITHLAVLEEAHEPVDVFPEDIVIIGVDPSIAGDEAVEFLTLFFSGR